MAQVCRKESFLGHGGTRLRFMHEGVVTAATLLTHYRRRAFPSYMAAGEAFCANTHGLDHFEAIPRIPLAKGRTIGQRVIRIQLTI